MNTPDTEHPMKNHCYICGNRIPDGLDTCAQAMYACDGPKTRESNTPDTEGNIAGEEFREELRTALTETDQQAREERIICSAVRYKGKVWMGHRHGNALGAMHDELSYTMNRREMIAEQTDREQGFVTSAGRYVDRAEGWEIAEKAGQILKRDYQKQGELYSEDLW